MWGKEDRPDGGESAKKFVKTGGDESWADGSKKPVAREERESGTQMWGTIRGTAPGEESRRKWENGRGKKKNVFWSAPKGETGTRRKTEKNRPVPQDHQTQQKLGGKSTGLASVKISEKNHKSSKKRKKIKEGGLEVGKKWGEKEARRSWGTWGGPYLTVKRHKNRGGGVGGDRKRPTRGWQCCFRKKGKRKRVGDFGESGRTVGGG